MKVRLLCMKLALCASLLHAAESSATSNADKTLEALAIDQMEKLVAGYVKNADTDGLLKCLRQRNPFLQEMAAEALLAGRGFALSLDDLADVIEANASPIDGSAEATAHYHMQEMLVGYVNRLTGSHYEYRLTVDPDPYLSIARDLRTMAKAKAENGSSSVNPGSSGTADDARASDTHRIWAWLLCAALLLVGSGFTAMIIRQRRP